MSGHKPYTMKEMKGIVDYLAEHKSYGELKGRKMWVDFANSSLTTRTWQSLKETFLKRILPDVQNPYYRLSREQVLSFKHGYDVAEKEKNNRLEIIHSDHPNNDENKKVSEQPSPNPEQQNEVEEAPGEDFQSEKISTRNRSSAETLVLDDIRDSNDNSEELIADEEPASKTFESDPSLIVKAVLDDFDTESDDTGGVSEMQIDSETNANKNNDQYVILVEDSEDVDNIVTAEKELVEGNTKSVDDKRVVDYSDVVAIVTEGGNEAEILPASEHEVVQKVIDDFLNENDVINVPIINDDAAEQDVSDITNASQEQIILIESTEPNVENTEHSENQNITKPTDIENNNKNSISSSNDTIIPNNQELLNKDVGKTNGILKEKVPAIRKRSTSQVSASKNIPQKVNGDIKETPPNSNNAEALFDVLENTASANKNTHTTQTVQNIEESNKNPCLKSVNLFEEQFNTTKYTDSEDDTPIPKNDVQETDKLSSNIQEKSIPDQDQADAIMVVDSQVDSNKPIITNEQVGNTRQETNEETFIQDTPMDTEAPMKPKKNVIELNSNSDPDVVVTNTFRQERYKRIEQAFGFVPGTSTTTRLRKSSLNVRPRTRSRRQGSSELESNYTDPNDSVTFVSPPRGRHQRHRRYQKPAAGRIINSEDNGRLYVLLGNKVLPVINDDGNKLRYVNYDDQEEEREEETWKQKYIEERRKAMELKKQLELARSSPKASSSRAKSPVPPPAARNGDSDSCKTVTTMPNTNNDCKMNILQGDSGKVQITLCNKNDQKINLEGSWPQVLPMMEQVMSIFYRTDNVVNGNKQEESKVDENVQKKENISEATTPIIPAVNTPVRKVDELEQQIFKEIEQRDKEDESKKSVPNIATKRKARSSNSTDSVKVVAPKRGRKSKLTLAKEAELVNSTKTATTDNQSKTTERLATDVTEDINKVPDVNNVANKQKEVKKPRVIPPIEPRVTRSRKSGNATDTSRAGSDRARLGSRTADSDDEARYMLPPEHNTRKSKTKSPAKARSPENPHEVSLECSRHSIDSTQGYQDSDISPSKLNITKRKKKLSLVVKKGMNVRRRSITSASVNESLNSSNSSYFVPKKTTSEPSIESMAYKTDSYQILMENQKHSKLEAIDKYSKKSNSEYFSTVSKISNNSPVIEVNSSNVSLPASPEISVVENLSLSRELIRNVSHPTINEQQANDTIVTNIYNKYLISDVDISVPLMQQDCELLNTPKRTVTKKGKAGKSPIKVSDLLDKVTVNKTVNNTLSETLDQKLRDLLLESAKKMDVNNIETNKDNLMEVDEPATQTKKLQKKRCSTPRKRGKKKSKGTVSPVLEEHTESCSHNKNGGRVSCPPLITFVHIDENANNSADVEIKTKKPLKPKKDIIKVKIQRPKKPVKITEAHSPPSVCTDSGINESDFLNDPAIDNVELIHNHSDTCLQAHECLGSSVEFIENLKSQSVFSISTESLESEILKAMENEDDTSAESNLVLGDDRAKVSEDIFATPSTTVYHSLADLANSSLVTEDLSEELHRSPANNWYLLSEDDTNTSHNIKPELMTSNARSYNYLKQLFPEVCTVPNLSTISEMSKENEDSRKSMDDT